MKKLKIKISFNRIFGYSYVIIIFIIIGSFSYVSYFLYNNFYKTITQTEEVLMLKEKVATEDINMNKFDQIIQNIKDKSLSKKLNIRLKF